MSKQRSVSKNNREGRSKSQEYLHDGKVIKPVKLILEKQAFLAAEYADSGELVMGQNGKPAPWNNAKNLS